MATNTGRNRPIITYFPLVGERFVRSFMAPIPPAAILSLIQAGNPRTSSCGWR